MTQLSNREIIEKRRMMIHAFQYSPFRFLRRVMIRWLKEVYAASDDPSYVYLEGENKQVHVDSGLIISGKAPFKPDTAELRPAIIYSRENTAGNYRGMGAGANVQTATLSNNYQQKTHLLSGGITLNCCSRTPDEAEHIAWLTWFWLQECKTLITGLGFHSLGEPVIGAVTPAPDALVSTTEPEWVFCPVSFNYSFQYSWESTDKLQAKLESIEVELVDEVETVIQTFLHERGES